MFDVYRKSFLEGNNVIWWGGETTYRIWDSDTMVLYFFIVVLAVLFGLYSDKRRINLVMSYRQQNMSYTVSFSSIMKYLKPMFLILLLILGFRHTSVGIDTIVYKGGIEEELSLADRFSGSTSEPLYKIFQYILHLVFDNGTIGLFIYSFLTLYLIYGGIKRYAGTIDLYTCILTYVCLYYFPAFNLLRISLAASIVFYNFHLIIEGNYKRFAIILLVTTLLHYSTIMMFFPFLSYLVYRKNKVFGTIIFCAAAVIVIASTSILGSYISLINRYSSYIDGNEAAGRLGIMLLIDYLPCIIMCFYIWLNKVKGQWADLMVCFTSSAFIIRLLAYYLSAAGRLGFHFPILTMILLPYWMNYLRVARPSLYKPMLIIYTFWAFIRLHTYFIGYLSTDGIMPYMFFWN